MREIGADYTYDILVNVLFKRQEPAELFPQRGDRDY
jgi:hypothetical protein